MLKIKKLNQYLWKIRKAKYKKGFSIHSPFAFHLVTQVLGEKEQYYGYQEIESLRDDLATTFAKNPRQTAARKNIRHYKQTQKLDRFLFRLVNHRQPRTIVEAGAGTAIGTLYLAKPAPHSRCIGVETDPTLLTAGQRVVEQSQQPNIQLLGANFLDEPLEQLSALGVKQIDMLVINLKQPALITPVWEKLKPTLHSQSVVVLRGNHQHNDLTQCWKQMKEEKEVVVSVDLYSMGLLFFDKTITPKHYALYY